MGLKTTVNKVLGFAGLAKKSAGETFYSLTDRQFLNSFFGTYGTSSPKWLEFRTREDYITAWEKCPPLASILINKAQADINGLVSFRYQGTQETVNIPYQGTAKKLKRLFARPNPLQTWRQFRSQQKIYQGLFGFCPVLMIRPAGFNDPTEVTAMWNLPPQYIKIHTTGKFLYAEKASDIIDKFEFVYNNTSDDLNVNDILLLKEQGISLKNEIVPDSRIRVLQYPISNVAAVYEAENVLITKRGALGILSNRDKDAGGAVAMTPTQKLELQNDFARYGLSKNQWQVIITNAQVEWQQMAMNPKDLMLLEILMDSTRTIADVYGYPFELIGNVKGVTFANKQQAKMMFYQDTVIPESQADFELYNQFFGMDNTGIELYYSFDHVEALQKSEMEKASAQLANANAAVIMFNNGIITLNRMREMLGEDTVAGDDKYKSEMPQPDVTTAEQQDTQNKNTTQA